MFDTMTMTKAIGALCGTFLVYLLGAWLAEEIYHTGGHGKHHRPSPSSASADDGEGLWRGCRSCHALEAGQHGTGPALYGVVNRPVQFYDDFNYSGALIDAAEVWTPEELNAFLENPRGYAPGTAMSYNGMRSAEDRANLIAYLATFAD